MKKIFSYFIIILLFVSFVSAEVKVVRESSDEIVIGDVLDVNISVFSDESLNFILREDFNDNVEFIDPVKVNKIYYNSLLHYRFVIESNVDAGKIRIFNYKIKPKEIGEFNLVPSQIFTDNEIYKSEVLSVLVKCIPDGECGMGENYLTCSEDCINSERDGVCNFKVDGICDLDCSGDVDCDYNEIGEKYIFFKVIEFFKNWFR